jgi:peptidyl-prolyl cis-trans isomerase SurA
MLAAARQKIESIQGELQSGADFADLARRYSEDPGTAAEGGDVGCFGPGQVAPEFEAAARQLKPGQVSPPVLTQYGYHLIRLREQRETELCASHVLVRAVATRPDRERAMARMEELRRRLAAGADFAQLARENSDDPQSARRGGLWQLFSRDQIPPELAPRLAGLGLGQISVPFSLEDGVHLLRVEDDPATLEGLVREARMADMMRRMIEEYKTQIHVENRLESTEIGQTDAFPAPGRLQGARMP